MCFGQNALVLTFDFVCVYTKKNPKEVALQTRCDIL